MKSLPSHFIQKTLLSKYIQRLGRLRKAVQEGRFSHFSHERKQLQLQCLFRYERQLAQWGIVCAASAALLAPGAVLHAQAPVPVGVEFRINTFTTDKQSFPAMAMDSNGDFVVAWQSNGQDGNSYGIYAQRYNNAGTPQGSEFRVNTYTTNSQTFPAVAMDSDGDFVVAWTSLGQDGNSYGIYAQRYNNAGTPQGSEFRVNTYTTNFQFGPAVAMDNDGDFVVSWSSIIQDGDGWGVYAQRYDNAGTPQGSEFRVNTYTTNEQRYPKVAMNSDGDFVVTWRSNFQDGSGSGIYAQRYDNLGTPQGAEFLVNTYTTSYQHYPAVAMDNDGNFVVVWQSYGQEGSNLGVFAQRYDNAGTPQGAEFLVNTYTTNFQNFPAVAMDSDGDLVVAWMSFGQDGSTYGIYAQHYDNAGTPQGSEFRVNTFTTGNQRYPVVAMDSGGDLVVAWNSYGQDGSNEGIYAQRYQLPMQLPIDLLYFEGTAQSSFNLLQWATATEKNTARHIVERSAAGTADWKTIGEVAASGNSTATVSYQWRDDEPLPLGYYRLASLDYDGAVQYSEIVAIARSGAELAIFNAYPQPADEEMRLDLFAQAPGMAHLTLTDMYGRQLQVQELSLPQGAGQVILDLSGLPAGLYQVTLTCAQQRVTRPVIKE